MAPIWCAAVVFYCGTKWAADRPAPDARQMPPRARPLWVPIAGPEWPLHGPQAASGYPRPSAPVNAPGAPARPARERVPVTARVNAPGTAREHPHGGVPARGSGRALLTILQQNWSRPPGSQEHYGRACRGRCSTLCTDVELPDMGESVCQFGGGAGLVHRVSPLPEVIGGP